MSLHRILTIILFSALVALIAVYFGDIDEVLAFTTSIFQVESNDMGATPVVASEKAVLVIGAGLAGLSAASEALARNVPVRLLERAKKPGGNSIKASSGINGAPTRFQKGEDITFFADTVKSAGQSMKIAPYARESQIQTLTNHSRAAIDWLVDDNGVDLSVVTQLGGHSYARTHRGAGKLPPGAAIVTTLLNKLNENPKFELLTGCEVTKLVQMTSSGKVEGVEAMLTDINNGENNKEKKKIILQGPVVFATGGFGGDANGMLAQYRPDLAGIPSTNDPRPGAHPILTAAGAKLIDMDKVQIHPTGFVDHNNARAGLKFLAAEMLRGEGGILLYRGERFVNEMETREHISNTIMKLPPLDDDNGRKQIRQWNIQLLLDPGACDAAASHIGFYLYKGLIEKKKIYELDQTTRRTLRDYSAVVRGKKADHLGRTAFGHWRLQGTDEEDNQEVCIGSVTPIVHFTMGGVGIDENSRVLVDEFGEGKKIIQGLWAAGEITGGIHGDNRLGGSSLLECVVFGRRAGQQAADYLKNV